MKIFQTCKHDFTSHSLLHNLQFENNESSKIVANVPTSLLPKFHSAFM